MQFGDPYGLNSFPSLQQEIVATDCSYNGFAWAYEQWDGSLPNVNGDKKTVRMINPHFGKAGDDRQVGWARLNCNENLYISGKSAGEKVDLRQSTALIHDINILDGGRVYITDAILRGSAWFGHTVNIDGNSNSPSTVTIERCILPPDASNGIGNRANDSGGTGTGNVVVNIINSIMTFGDGVIDFTGLSATKLNLLHCTIYNKPTDSVVTAIKLGGNDLLKSDYSIFAVDDLSNQFASAGFTGTRNIISPSTADGFGGAIPADTVKTDNLQLTAAGRLVSGSAAVNAAIGSTLGNDIDGDTRPQGTQPDVGADELAPNPWTNFHVMRTGMPPVLDGVVNTDEWAAATPLIMNHGTMQNFGGSMSTGSTTTDAQMSGTFRFLWDQTYLYVSAQIATTTVSCMLNELTNGEPTPLNGTDAIQFCLDHQNLKTGNEETPGIYILDVVPGFKDNLNKTGYYQHWGTPRNTLSNTVTSGRKLAGAYELEFKIKWSDLTPNPITPAAGSRIGYLALILDVDAQFVDLWWNGGSGANIISAPASWNTMILDEPVVNATGKAWTLY
jgi:hypothetical protein